jgi:hypothetical protein
MSTAIAKKKPAGPDPEKLYRAWTSFASAHGDAVRGETFRGSEPIVTAVFSNFVPADTPMKEWPSPFDHAIEAAAEKETAEREAREQAFAEAASQNKVKLAPPRLFKALRDVQCHLAGVPATIVKGSIVLDGDLLLYEHADSFRAV